MGETTNQFHFRKNFGGSDKPNSISEEDPGPNEGARKLLNKAVSAKDKTEYRNAVMWFSQHRSGIRDKDAIQSTRKLQGRSGGSFLVIGTNILPLVSPMHN